jgi:hypothetical protein
MAVMAERKPVLIMQDTWLRWTKATRAAADAAPRLAVPRAHLLPYLLLPRLANEGTLRHEVAALESDGFEQLHRVRAIDDPAWAQDLPIRPDNIGVRRRGDDFEVRLSRPFSSMLVTAWPGHLPAPLFTGKVGEAVRIDWNGRFRSSLSGSNRSYFFEEHTVWVALLDSPIDKSLLELTPRKHIDLRTQIY